MAKVEMDLSELDKLRQDKLNAIAEKEAKIEEIQKLKEEIISVKSDKRTVRITKINNITKDIDSSNLLEFIRHEFHTASHNRDLYEAIKRGIRAYENHTYVDKCSVKHDNTKEVIDFINFEDIKELLSKELEIKYQKELTELRGSKRDFENKILALQEKHESELKTVNSNWNKAVETLEIQLEETKKTLYNTIIDKDTRKKELILEEKIAKLEKDLQDEKTKGFFKKLLNL